MTILSILDTIFFGPIMLLMECSFNLLKKFELTNYILLFLFSLSINILTLPLYLRAEVIQAEVKKKENMLKKGIEHIEENFSGDEKLFILNAYYKQNGYRQFNIIKCMLPLILEVPFFICAYRFLSFIAVFDNDLLFNSYNVSIMLPDNLIHINNVNINLLPIIMVLINYISTFIYLKNKKFKQAILMYIMPLIFLFLLYNSPSGLVLYWIYNNIFSLIKNLVFSFKHNLIKNNITSDNLRIKNIDKRVMVLILFNIVLFSLFIPLSFIYTSINEFIVHYSSFNLILVFVHIFCLSFGLFGIWYGMGIYLLLSNRGKIIYERILFLCTMFFISNYLIFITCKNVFSMKLYILSYNSPTKIAIIIGFILFFIGVVSIIYFKLYKVIIRFFVLFIISMIFFSLICIYKINFTIRDINSKIINDNKLELSTNGKNVIVMVLDTAIGHYIPYIFQEKQELKKVFSGFKYYPNIITHGPTTEYGLPAIMGGYEYTPVEMNKRKDEKLIDKQYEAFNVLPLLFKNNGFNSHIFLTDNVGFSWPKINDEVKTSILNSQAGLMDTVIKKFFMFSISSAMPSIIQVNLYDSGNYLCSQEQQYMYSIFKAKGRPLEYNGEYNILNSLSSICEVKNSEENNFMFFMSTITHPPNVLLQTPNYDISDKIDNEEYYRLNYERFYYKGVNVFESDFNNYNQLENFLWSEQSNMCKYNSEIGAILCISNFIQFLKQNNIYDNTRIIIVSDHGSAYPQFNKGETLVNDFSFVPLLMVKDFNSQEFLEDNTFMTNADVPTIAIKNLIEKPINPFTGKMINNSEKMLHKQIIYNNGFYDIHQDKILKPSSWFRVNDNIYDLKNWEYTKEEYVLDKYELPKDDCHSVLH